MNLLTVAVFSASSTLTGGGFVELQARLEPSPNAPKSSAQYAWYVPSETPRAIVRARQNDALSPAPASPAESCGQLEFGSSRSAAVLTLAPRGLRRNVDEAVAVDPSRGCRRYGYAPSR